MKLEKSKQLISLINHLQQKFGAGVFKIKDFWEADLEAIGFSNLDENRLVYLSTYHLPKGYFISLESGSINTDKSKTIANYKNISVEKVELLFAAHLEIE